MAADLLSDQLGFTAAREFFSCKLTSGPFPFSDHPNEQTVSFNTTRLGPDGAFT